MTNISRSFVHNRIILAVLLVALSGCGEEDGVDEIAAGRDAYAAGQLEKADRFYEESLAISSTNLSVLVESARIKLELGEIALADERIARAAAMAPNDLDIVELGAQIAYHGKNYDKAKRAYASMAGNRENTPAVQARGWAGLGVIEMTVNENDRARISFLRALQLDRSNAAAWYHLGMLYRNSFGYLEAALNQFESYVRLEQHADLRVQKVQREIIPELKDAISRAASERPGAAMRNSAKCSEELLKAEADWKKKQYKTAKSHYAAALKADPLSYKAAVGLAKVCEVSDTSVEGKKQTLEAYKIACRLRAFAVSTFIVTGDLALNLGQYATAVDLYSRAVAVDPTNITAIDGLIRSLRKAGGKGGIANLYQRYRESIPVKKH